MTVRYAPMQRYSRDIAPSAGMLRYMYDDSCDVHRARKLGMSDAEYLTVIRRRFRPTMAELRKIRTMGYY